MLDFSFFPVPKLDFNFLLTHTGALTTFITGWRRLLDANTGSLSADGARCRGNIFAFTGIVPTLLTNFFFQWLPIPLRIGEMLISIYKVIDGKKLLAIKQSGAAA